DRSGRPRYTTATLQVTREGATRTLSVTESPGETGDVNRTSRTAALAPRGTVNTAVIAMIRSARFIETQGSLSVHHHRPPSLVHTRGVLRNKGPARKVFVNRGRAVSEISGDLVLNASTSI